MPYSMHAYGGPKRKSKRMLPMLCLPVFSVTANRSRVLADLRMSCCLFLSLTLIELLLLLPLDLLPDGVAVNLKMFFPSALQT